MAQNNIVNWIIYFIISVIVAWLALSLILIWVTPALFNADGSLNWWNTLWVAALVVLLAWLIMLLVAWIMSLFNRCDPCKKVDPCAKPDPCDPCPKPVVKVIDPCDPCAKVELREIRQTGAAYY